MELKSCFNIILKLPFLRSFLKVLSWRACAALRHQCSWLEATACMASRSLGLSCRVAVFGLGGFQCLNSTSFLSKWQGGGWHGWHGWHECSGKGGQRENSKVQFRAKTLKTFQTCLSLIKTKNKINTTKTLPNIFFPHFFPLHLSSLLQIHCSLVFQRWIGGGPACCGSARATWRICCAPRTTRTCPGTRGAQGLPLATPRRGRRTRAPASSASHSDGCVGVWEVVFCQSCFSLLFKHNPPMS